MSKQNSYLQAIHTYMKLYFITLLRISLFFLTTAGFSQSPRMFDPTVYTIVETPPEFPGGSGALKEYMQKQVQYPAEAQKVRVRDRVFVSFIVELDGNLTNIMVLQGPGFGCDEEAIRVVKEMPRWTPGSQSGKAVRTKYHLPILFGLDYPKPKGH